MMHRGISIIAALTATLLTATICAAGENDVLYWMVDNTATVRPANDTTTQTIGDFFGGYAAPSDSSFAARIRVTGGNIGANEDVFLDLYNPADGSLESGEFGIDFDDGTLSGYWGAGVPTGNQSPTGDYSAGSPEFSFTIELGNVVWDGSSLSWTTIATSAAATYSSLSDYIHRSFDLDLPTTDVWTPTAYVVPEPSCGLLTVFGFALLALRRRRFTEGD